MSRQKRKKVLGAALVLFGLLASSGTATAWELSLGSWRVESASVVRILQLAWPGARGLWQATTSAGSPESGQPQNPPSAPSAPGDPGSNAEHSVGIDPNG